MTPPNHFKRCTLLETVPTIQTGSTTPDPKPKEPIDKLLEWMDGAVAHVEKLLDTDEEVITSAALSAHYSGVVSGYRIARTKAREIKQNSTN